MINEEQYRGAEVYLDANGFEEMVSYTPPGFRLPPKFEAAWRVTIQESIRDQWSSDTTYVCWVDSIRRGKRSDGRKRYYVRYVVRRDHEDYARSNTRWGTSDYTRTPMSRAVLEISRRAVRDLIVNLPCCVKHVLIGRYDGTECVGLRATSSAPSTSPSGEAG